MGIALLNDRMVLFSSMHLLHGMLPSTAERYCFTIWISAGALTAAEACMRMVIVTNLVLQLAVQGLGPASAASRAAHRTAQGCSPHSLAPCRHSAAAAQRRQQQRRRALSRGAPLGEQAIAQHSISWVLLLRGLAAALFACCDQLYLQLLQHPGQCQLATPPSSPAATPAGAGRDEAWQLLMHDEIRKHAAKWHYRGEW